MRDRPVFILLFILILVLGLFNSTPENYLHPTHQTSAKDLYSKTTQSFTETFNSTADTFLDEMNPNTNYGGQSYLILSNKTTNQRYAFLKFSFTTTTSLSSAILSVCVANVVETRNVTIYNATNAWDEYTLTWDNRPAFDPTIVDQQLAVTNGQWLAFNITSLVKASVSQTLSVVLQTNDAITSSGNPWIASKEYSDGNYTPHLSLISDVTLEGPIIDKPPDQTIFYGTKDNTIVWHPSHPAPSKYIITHNATIIDSNDWDGGSIAISIDNLEVGEYSYTLFVNDTDGRSAADIVIISVVVSAGLYPIADTFVNESKPNANYGGQPYLGMGNATGARRITYLKFNLPSIIRVREASLYVYGRATQTSNITIHNASNSWVESALTWNNRPSFDPAALEWQLAVSNGQWLVFNLTSFVEAMDGQNVTFVLQSSDVSSRPPYPFLSSREYASEMPYLHIQSEDIFSTSISPLADSFVNESNPNVNYGGQSYLKMGNTTNALHIAYVKFNLPNTANLHKATLHLYARTVQTCNITVYNASNTWDEHTLTWNNRPSFDPTVVDWQLAVSNGQWLVFNITSLVEAMNGENIAIALQSNIESNVKLYPIISSRENSTDEAPHVTITAVDTSPPNITIISPLNGVTYKEGNISLEYDISEKTTWIGYSLDGASNITITENMSLSIDSEGNHSIVLFAEDYNGNMGKSEAIWFSLLIVPVPPQIRTAVIERTDVRLTWIAPSFAGNSSVKEYRLYRANISGGPYSYLNNTTELSLVDYTANSGQIYYYVITAVNDEGESNYSNEIWVYIAHQELHVRIQSIYANSSKIKLIFLVEDNKGIEVDDAQITISIQKDVWNGNTSLNGTFSIAFAYTPKQLKIKVKVTKPGYLTNIVELIVDPPGLEYVNPVDYGTILTVVIIAILAPALLGPWLLLWARTAKTNALKTTKSKEE